MQKQLSSISIEAKNSLGFLQEVFKFYDEGQLFTIKRAGLDLSKYPGLKETRFISVDNQRGWGQIVHQPRSSNEPGQIVFTSGTEGIAKPILLSQSNMADVVTRLNKAMQLDDTVREYIGIPVTYSFGLARARAVSAMNGAFFLPEIFNPVEIRDMLNEGEINAISAVPSLWRTVLANPQIIGTTGEKVKWIEIGSQYMSRAEKEAMKQIFPKARILQHYGLTEASRSSFLDITNLEGEALESVGRATGDIELKIGSKSEICIRGSNVALGMLEANGDIAPLVDEDGWLHTKDRGEIRDGLLWYQGRLDDQINIAGIKISAEALEQEIGALVSAPGTYAITSIPDSLRGESILLAISEAAGDKSALLEAAAHVALERHGINQNNILHVVTVTKLPLTGTGKIQRQTLRDNYVPQEHREQAVTSPNIEAEPLSTEEQKVIETWQSVIGNIPMQSDSTFYDAGGDSLSAIQIGMAMEAGFSRAAIRATLEGRTVREIAALTTSKTNEKSPSATERLPQSTVETWGINVTRGIMVIAVLISHWAPGVFERLNIGTEAEHVLSFIYRMGTPGFAIVFGIGMGYFMLPDYAVKKLSVKKRLRSALVLVFCGLLLIAGTKILLHAMQGDQIDAQTIASAFYNILGYYLLALLSSVAWLNFLSVRRSPAPWAIAAAILFWLCWWMVMHLLGPFGRLESLLEWPRLMMVAGYSYFKVSAYVFVGLAAGYWLSQQENRNQAADNLLTAGIIGISVSLIGGFEAHGVDIISARSAPFFGSTLGLVFYVGIVIMILGLSIRLIKQWYKLPKPAIYALQSLIIIGGLALPIYAFHGLVIPIKDILAIAGLSASMALFLPLSIFIVAVFCAGWRLRRMYFT